MRQLPLALALVGLLTFDATALTLENLRVEATQVQGSSKDPFRIRAALRGIDVNAVVGGPMAIRLGNQVAHVPAGAFRKRGRANYSWKSYSLGVKKVSINVKKSTLDIVGGGVELGELSGSVPLAIGTIAGVGCGSLTWTDAGKRGRGQRKVAVGPLVPCPSVGVPEGTPLLLITAPTDTPGVATGSATITLGGVAQDDVGVTALSWSSDRGGGASVLPSTNWAIADVPLQPGDNRLTVSATDTDGHTASDTIVVTYNTNGLTFTGVPNAEPDFVPAGGRDSIKIRQGVSGPDLDPATIELMQIAPNGSMTSVGPMADDGAIASGDQIPGDNFWTRVANVEASANGPARYRIQAKTTTDPATVALSPIIEIPALGGVGIDELADATVLADQARALLAHYATTGASLDEAIDEVVTLAGALGAKAAGGAEGGQGAWWVTGDGLLGAAFAYDQGTTRGGTPRPPLPTSITRPLDPPAPGLPGDPNPAGTRRTLVLAPYFADAEPAALASALGGLQCPTFPVDEFAGATADAGRFKQMEEYGLVVIASHGDALFGGLGAAYDPTWDWATNGAQVLVATATTLTNLTLGRWEHDLRRGRLAILPGGVVAVLPSYISRYTARMPGTLVYVGSCNSSQNPTLSAAFLGRGAGAFLGFDGYVSSSFAASAATTLLTDLLDGSAVGDAFTPGQTDGAATFTLAGSPATSLAVGPIANASFEHATGFLASVTGFTVLGDGRVIGKLGTWLPTDGSNMAIVSTGLGLTTAAGSFEQAVCLPPVPPGATKLTLAYDWNFFSEEFIEYCGSQFQDSFLVTFGANVLQSTKIDDICGEVVPDEVDFDRGDVYTTGWRTQVVDLTSLAGTTAVLRFAAKDVGDSIFDSAILVDRVRLFAE